MGCTWEENALYTLTFALEKVSHVAKYCKLNLSRNYCKPRLSHKLNRTCKIDCHVFPSLRVQAEDATRPAICVYTSE